MELSDEFDELLAQVIEPSSPKKIRLGESNNSEPDRRLLLDAIGLEPLWKYKEEAYVLQWTSDGSKKRKEDRPPHCLIQNLLNLTYNFCQRGNPLLKFITSVPWEYEDIVPDYEIGKTIGILFLSLQYYNLNPDYINNRLKELGKKYELRILLVQVDLKDPHNPLKNLNRICLLTDLTLMLAWNPEEAAKIIENYKIFENKPPDKIMEKIENDPHQKIVNALSSVKPINKTDAITLITTFGTLENIIKASESRLAQCPGLGVRKAQKLYRVLHEPFLKKENIKSKDFEEDFSIEDIEKGKSDVPSSSSV